MIAPREAKKNIISLPTNIVTLFWPPLSSRYSTKRETGHWLSEYAHCQGFLQALPTHLATHVLLMSSQLLTHACLHPTPTVQDRL